MTETDKVSREELLALQEKLVHCPFCKKRTSRYLCPHDEQPGIYFVFCALCCSKGPQRLREEAAIAGWNATLSNSREEEVFEAARMIEGCNGVRDFLVPSKDCKLIFADYQAYKKERSE